ncbi:MAG: hypothetical protein KAI29_06755, partial [Cyclobacteriaceae bacterium]|nr:hypothetical protein [Cyclobacteriaceae bacterium]
MNKLNLFNVLTILAVLASCGNKIGKFFGERYVTTQAEMGLNELSGDDVTVSTAPIVTELISTPILSK